MKEKDSDSSQSLRLDTRSAGSTRAVLTGAWSPVGRLGCGRRGRWSQGGFPGVLLEFHQLATFTRVDSENHALLAMASLPTVEPHRVRVFHSE
jgi:hypothetical protein